MERERESLGLGEATEVDFSILFMCQNECEMFGETEGRRVRGCWACFMNSSILMLPT